MSTTRTAFDCPRGGFTALPVNLDRRTRMVSKDGIIKGLTPAIPTPTLSNLTPASFPATFRAASLTPYSFDLVGLFAGAVVSISVQFANHIEEIVALGFDAVWKWPFDLQPANSIGALASEPVHITLLPRDGWPVGTHIIQVAAALRAVAP